jgi:hypothetical protein
VVVHVVADQATVEGSSQVPGYLIGGDQLIPAELVRELAKNAKTRPLINPLDAPPEPGYVPSKALADFVRYRDVTCRAPGCDVPASRCDIDHTIPYAQGGLTHASNLSCKCRTHHLEKTFGGWRDLQLPDGTLIWTLPDGQVYVTTPGSALLFPNLCQPTGQLPAPATGQAQCSDRAAMMPKRRRTRAQNRAQKVAAERRQNRDSRRARRKKREEYYADLLSPVDGDGDGEPPPF